MDVLAAPKDADDERPPGSRRRLVVAGGVTLGVLVVAVLAFTIFQPIQVLPRIRVAPGFSLVDHTGALLTSEDLRGDFVVVGFTYGDCPPPCGGTVEAMTEVAGRTAGLDLGDVDLTFLVVSVDPEHDTPARLAAMAEGAGATGPEWRFATVEDPDRLKTLVGSGFKTYYAPQPDGSIELSPVIVLVDGWGMIRGEYRYETVASLPDRITRHIGVLAEEVTNSEGPARLAYEAAHLFLCYAD